jgi:hypothetical protein
LGVAGDSFGVVTDCNRQPECDTALDFAPNLHTADVNAGTLNGPTVADNVTPRSEVVANDVESLLAAVRKRGLADEGPRNCRR